MIIRKWLIRGGMFLTGRGCGGQHVLKSVSRKEEERKKRSERNKNIRNRMIVMTKKTKKKRRRKNQEKENSREKYNRNEDLLYRHSHN